MFFNPPWNASLKTCIGDLFLDMIDRHFPKGSPMHKYINRHCVKVSYCTTRNIKAHISAHNRRILNNHIGKQGKSTAGCNCRSGESRLKAMNKKQNKPLDTPAPDWFSPDCPVNGTCLTESVIYSASVSTENSTKEYIGLSCNSFKSRYSGHVDSFRHRNRGQTTLSSYLWDLDDKKTKFSLEWRIRKRATTYKPGASYCDLCITEKVAIMLADPKKSLNMRSEVLEMCRHRHQFKLGNMKE